MEKKKYEKPKVTKHDSLKNIVMVTVILPPPP